MRYWSVLLAAPVVLLLADACYSPAAPAAGAALPAQQVTVTGTDDFRMNPSSISVNVGQPLEVTFENRGEILHDFTAQQGLARPVAIVEQGGGSGTAVIRYDRPGTYKFLCAQPGHDQLGMHGTITVQ